MRIGMLTVILTDATGFLAGAFGQTVSVALPCDKVRSKLEELVKRPDVQDIHRITDLLVVAVLASCNVPKGTTTCYQCLDKNEKLTAIQLLQEKSSGKFKVVGRGCKCP